MNYKILLFALALLMLGNDVFAQDATEENKDGWKTGASLGLDFAQLFQLNPKQGAGENRIAFGGAFGVFANYTQGRIAWDNLGSLNLGVQKLGGGKFIFNPDIKVPFQKSIDELRLNSKFGYKTAENSKLYYSADFSFLSQLTDTYAGNYMRDISDEGKADPIAKLFSPATITFALGLDYKVNDKLSIFYSPAAIKAIIVADDNIADDQAFDADFNPLGVSVHGNPWRSETDFDNVFFQFGSLLKATYVDKLLNDRIAWKSQLALYSNYLNNPQNIDVEWINEFGINIFKGFQISLLTNLFYDHDVLVQVTDFDKPGGTNGLGRRVSFTEQLLIKYNIIF